MGVTILQGISVLTVEPLLRVAEDLAFYLDAGSDLQAGIERCKRWSLQARSLWLPGRGQSDDDFLRGFESRDSNAFLRQYMHEEHYAIDQRNAVPQGNVVKMMWGSDIFVQGEGRFGSDYPLEQVLQAGPHSTGQRRN